MTDAPHDDGGGPSEANRPAQEMRLRSSRPPVTRLSRKVLLGLGAAAAIGIGGALFFALKPQHQTTGSELYNTNNRNTPDGLANLPRDYTGLPETRSPAWAAASGRPWAADPECRRTRARHARAGGGTKSRGTAHCPGARSGAGEPPLCNDECRSDRVAFADTGVGAVCSRGGKRWIIRPHVPGSQARFSQRERRSTDNQSRSDPAAGQPIRAAGRRGDSGIADHRPALRSARPSHRTGD